jgi:hypothetical protein
MSHKITPCITHHTVLFTPTYVIHSDENDSNIGGNDVLLYLGNFLSLHMFSILKTENSKTSENGHFHLQDKYTVGIPAFSVGSVRQS